MYRGDSSYSSIAPLRVRVCFHPISSGGAVIASPLDASLYPFSAKLGAPAEVKQEKGQQSIILFGGEGGQKSTRYT